MLTGYEVRNAIFRSYGIRKDPEIEVFDAPRFRKTLAALRKLAAAVGS